MSDASVRDRRPRPPRLAGLQRDRPDWRPWLALYETVLASTSDPAWSRAVPRPERTGREHLPLLAERTLTVETGAVSRLLRMLAGALDDGSAGHAVAGYADTRGIELLEAGICCDRARLDTLAADMGAPAETVRVLATFTAMPLLLACGGVLAPRVPPSWRAGHCPICGAWPAVTEARGLEAARRFRCGRCGTDWHADWLACPYCGNREHTLLGALVPSEGHGTQKVETCKGCLGYVKTVTALTPCPSTEVTLLDLETVPLDVAALEAGCHRPEGLAVDLRIRLQATSGRRRLLSWIP